MDREELLINNGNKRHMYGGYQLPWMFKKLGQRTKCINQCVHKC